MQHFTKRYSITATILNVLKPTYMISMRNQHAYHHFSIVMFLLRRFLVFRQQRKMIVIMMRVKRTVIMTSTTITAMIPPSTLVLLLDVSIAERVGGTDISIVSVADAVGFVVLVNMAEYAVDTETTVLLTVNCIIQCYHIFYMITQNYYTVLYSLLYILRLIPFTQVNDAIIDTCLSHSYHYYKLSVRVWDTVATNSTLS